MTIRQAAINHRQPFAGHVPPPWPQGTGPRPPPVGETTPSKTVAVRAFCTKWPSQAGRTSFAAVTCMTHPGPFLYPRAVRDFTNKSCANVTFPDCTKIQAVLKSVARAASPGGQCERPPTGSRLEIQVLGRASSPKKSKKICLLCRDFDRSFLELGLHFKP